MNKYPELESLRRVSLALDELKIPYYITGGFAVSQYGRNRFTADIDIVIKTQKFDIEKFAAKIDQIFPQGYIDQDLIEQALKYKSEFNVLDPESGLKLDFFIAKETDFEKACFNRVQKKNYDYDIRFISPEDLIISKLLWFRESESTRQLEDIVSVLNVQADIDREYIDSWMKKLDIQAEWQKTLELKERDN